MFFNDLRQEKKQYRRSQVSKVTLGNMVCIIHYHTENGIFRKQLIQEYAQAQWQTMSYCGVRTYHQNGLVDRLICDMQNQGRMVLLHAKHRWLDAITEHLWPYACTNQLVSCGSIRSNCLLLAVFVKFCTRRINRSYPEWRTPSVSCVHSQTQCNTITIAVSNSNKLRESMLKEIATHFESKH